MKLATIPRAGLVLLLVALSLRNAGAESADTIRIPASKAAALLEQQKGAESVPLSLAHGLPIEREVPVTALEPVDTGALIEEDAKSEEFQYRAGIGREVTVRDGAGTWTKVEGGWLWSADVLAKGAKSLRLHISSFDASEGAELQVYAPGDSRLPAPSYRLRGPLELGAFWSGVVPGERARIEYFEPGNSAEPPARVPFVVDQLSHLYRSMEDNSALPGTNEGPCHNDVMCFPAWANERDATGWIMFTTASGSTAFCSGTMLTTLYHDFTPYFLTASHCVGSAAEAASVVFRWNFQTTSCGGPLPSTFPFSSVSTLVETNSDVDISLLMVEGALPAATVAWAGWDSNNLGLFSGVTCIHHPTGAFKRISFGTIAFDASTCLQAGLADQVIFSSGIVEPGSSGGGLFSSATRHLTGVLSCGPPGESCSTPGYALSYGHFSYIYPYVQAALVGGDDDALEHNLVADNDQCDFATDLPTGTHAGLICKIFDDDWYAIDPSQNELVSISATYTHAFGDINLELYDGCGTLVASSNGTTGSESIQYVSPLGAPLRLRVLLADDVRNTYSLTLGLTPAPNLDLYTVYGGVDRPIVPRNAPDAYHGNIAVPAALASPGPSGPYTYLNWLVYQSGPGPIGVPWVSKIYRDLEYEVGSTTVPAESGPGFHESLNVGPQGFRGGRHSLTGFADATHVVAEIAEDDNINTFQYVWSPQPFVHLGFTQSGLAPHQGYSALPNCDGYQGTGEWWGAFAMSPQDPNDDYDIALYNDYAGTFAGFETPLSLSYAFSGTDFVIWNGNAVGYGATRQCGITRAYTTDPDLYTCSFVHETSTTVVPTGYGETTVEDVSMGPGQLLSLHEVYLDASQGLTYTFKLAVVYATLKLNLSLFGPNGAYFSRFDCAATSEASAPGEWQQFDYRPTQSGYYAVVAWKADAGDGESFTSYRLLIGPSLSNLSEWITPVGGWPDIIVPRNAPLATMPPAITPTLDGDQPTTRVNWEVGQLGPNPAPPFSTEAWIDGEPAGGSYSSGSATPPGTYYVADDGPYIVSGGRHSITAWVDPDDLVAESNEGDNRAVRQFIWSPVSMSLGAPMVRAAPPEHGYFPYYNSDGFEMRRDEHDAWLVSMAPLSASSDYDLWVATDYSGSTSGFSDFPVWSLWGGDYTDFCVGSSWSPYVELFPEVTRAWTDAPGGSYVIDATSSAGKNRAIGESFIDQTIGSGHLANVYQFYMAGGRTNFLSLRRTGGTATIRLEAFSENGTSMNGRGSGSVATPLSDELATLGFTPRQDGWYPVVVYRENASYDLSKVVFDLHTSAEYPVSVEAPNESFEIALAGAAPNPMRDDTRIEFSLHEEGPVRLDVFDLRGRRVRTLADGVFGAGRHFLPWDGRDEAGQAAGAGVYWTRLLAGGRTFSKRLVMVR